MVNIHLCQLWGNLHTNNCKNEFNGTCIHVIVNLLIWVKMFTYLFVGKRTRLRKKKGHRILHQKNVLWLWQFINVLKRNPKKGSSIAGIKCLKEHCRITEICLQHVLYFSIYYILVYYTVGSITFFEQYTVADPEGVRGVQSNPPWCPIYFIFIGISGKMKVKWSNRTPAPL